MLKIVTYALLNFVGFNVRYWSCINYKAKNICIQQCYIDCETLLHQRIEHPNSFNGASNGWDTTFKDMKIVVSYFKDISFVLLKLYTQN